MDGKISRGPHQAALDTLLLPLPRVRAGKMFGYPAYFVGGKLFACLYGQVVGVRLPADTVCALLAAHAHIVPFRPLGKPRMREWVEIDRADPRDLGRDADVLRLAHAYVGELANGEGARR